GRSRLSARSIPERDFWARACRQKIASARGETMSARSESHASQASLTTRGPRQSRVLNVRRPARWNHSWFGHSVNAIRRRTPAAERPRSRRPRNVCGGHELPTTSSRSGGRALSTLSTMALQPRGQREQHGDRVAAARLERRGIERDEKLADAGRSDEVV